MNYRAFIAAACAAVLLSGVAVTVAQPQGPPAAGMRRGPGGPFDGAQGRPGGGFPGLRALDLTDAQKDQIKQINESHRAEMEQLAAQMRQLREKIQGEILTVLTPEQQQKLKEQQAQRGRRRQ